MISEFILNFNHIQGVQGKKNLSHGYEPCLIFPTAMGPCLYTPLAVTSLKTYPANLQDGNKASVYPFTQAASFTAEFALQPKMGILTDLPYPYLSTTSDDSVLPTQSSNIKTLFKLEGMVFHSTGVLLISYGNDKSSKPLLKQNEHYTTFCPVRQPLTQFIQVLFN